MTIPSGFPTIPCPAGRTSDSPSDIQRSVLPSGQDPVTETHDSGLAHDQIVAGELLTRNQDAPSPDDTGDIKRAFPVYYYSYIGLANDAGQCMEMLRSVNIFPFDKGGYTRGTHRSQLLPPMDHARYVKMRLLQVDPRFRDPGETYTFAAVDDKTKQQLHKSNTRSTTYSNIQDAGEGFM